jgi:hypothetical protein
LPDLIFKSQVLAVTHLRFWRPVFYEAFVKNMVFIRCKVVVKQLLTELYYIDSYQTATQQDLNSFFADPLFANTIQTIPDFHLTQTSRCLNAGNAALITNTAELDFAGSARLNRGMLICGRISRTK